MKAENIPIEKIVRDPLNPRTDFTLAKRDELAASLRLFGVKVPLIGYAIAEGVMLGDGHCRLEAAKMVGLKTLPVIVFPERPDEATLLATQLTVNVHRHELNPVDEYEAFLRLAKLKGWAASELAAGLAVSNAEVTRVLSIGKLSADEKQLVRAGKIGKSVAYALSRMPVEERAALARQAAAGEITRDQLHSKARRLKNTESVKSRRVSCLVPSGSVTVQATAGLCLGGLIELLEGLIRDCRKARRQGLDITTAVRVMRDKCRAEAAS